MKNIVSTNNDKKMQWNILCFTIHGSCLEATETQSGAWSFWYSKYETDFKLRMGTDIEYHAKCIERSHKMLEYFRKCRGVIAQQAQIW